MRIPGLREISPADLGRRIYHQFNDDRMATFAAALSYSTLVALFPFLIFLVALLEFLHIPQFFTWILDQARSALPADAYQRVEEVITKIQNEPQRGVLSFGILAALWAASSGVRALMGALNVAYGVEETRRWWKRYLLSVVYTLALVVLLIAAAGLMLLGPQAMEWLANRVGLSHAVIIIWTWLRFPVLVVLLMLLAAVIYYAVPNIKQPFRFITPGAVLAVVIWMIASVGFSLYVSTFANFSAT